ncbi:MAG: hypothetical protein IPL28_18210 [Chloroflexi bacterium]|nr:hypothetical protein [Chloroflexota bacterium]
MGRARNPGGGGTLAAVAKVRGDLEAFAGTRRKNLLTLPGITADEDASVPAGWNCCARFQAERLAKADASAAHHCAARPPVHPPCGTMDARPVLKGSK